MFSLKDLRYIQLLHEHKNFSKAAQAAGVSQPALSSAISKIEERLNITLFYRDTHTVAATYFGEYLAQRAQSVLNEVSDIEERIGSLRDQRSGSVRFGVGNIIADTVLIDSVTRFCAKHPSVYPQFMLGYWYDLRQRLLQGDISFFVTANHQQTEDDQITERLYHRQAIKIFARAGHPVLERDPIRCADLIEFPLLTYQTVIARRMVRERLRTEEQLRKMEQNFPAATLEHMGAAGPLICGSDYLVMAPAGLFAPEIQNGGIRVLAVQDFQLSIDAKIVTRAKTLLSPAEEDMVRCLEESRDLLYGAPSRGPAPLVAEGALA